MKQEQLLGPFSQIVTLRDLPQNGPLPDSGLKIVEGGGVLTEGGLISKVLERSAFERCRNRFPSDNLLPIGEKSVLIPGLVDSHTHICYGGSRADDYARRLRGETYLEIARKGGGILSTVTETRKASAEQLANTLCRRAYAHLTRGVTTCEVKSGYGLDFDTELKMLRVINRAAKKDNLPDLIPTCLSAHVKPEEFESHSGYLDYVAECILTAVKRESLSRRVDIFVEKGAFGVDMSMVFVKKAKAMGFDITVHANQFSGGGSHVAAETGAVSADHLESSEAKDWELLQGAGTVATVLPGASMGLGLPFAPVRKMLDAGLSLAIASDWNPGSAPMGDLLMQAAVLGAAERLTLCETLAAITVRAAKTLRLNDRGLIKPGYAADMIAFPCSSYKDIFYHQGSLKPHLIWKRGRLIGNRKKSTGE